MSATVHLALDDATALAVDITVGFGLRALDQCRFTALLTWFQLVPGTLKKKCST